MKKNNGQQLTKRQWFGKRIVEASPFLEEETKTSIHNYCEANSSVSDAEFFHGFQSSFPWLEYHITLMNAHRIQNTSFKTYNIHNFTRSTRNHLVFYTVLIVLSIIISIFTIPFRI